MSAPDNPLTWREGFAKLSASILPCPGFRNEEWRSIYDATKRFLETCASEAAGKGWTGLELFGVHEAVGAANVSACGALMIGTTTTPVEEIRPEWISFGRTRYYRAPQQSAVLVWRFGA